MIIDLCAGPGGWDEGLRTLGRTDVTGIEVEINAIRTRVAAGHDSFFLKRPEECSAPGHKPKDINICGDMTHIDPLMLLERWSVEGLIGSPPCQDYSLAGLKAGESGERGQLVWEPIRYAEALDPDWIALEEVPTVLPMWKHFETIFSAMGYFTWSGVLDASDYGVPQQRKRAILMASKKRFGPPAPTHGDPEAADLFGSDFLLPKVTMAQALGWTGQEIILDSRGDGDGEWTRSGSFTSDRPSRTLGEKARSWRVIPPPDPCPEWPFRRPATTVVGSFRPDIMAAPGWRKDPAVPRQKAPDSVPITVEQALILQSFPVNYPIQGARTRAFEQVGNAIPPLLAAAILKELL
jgi:DNA (cytosine-5)-methyltransferase 1